MVEAAKAFFERDGAFFVGADSARGPWHPGQLHAGPVAALTARALEQAVGPEKPLARLTLDLIRPAPISGLRFEASVTRSGRTLATSRAEMLDREGVVCATATGLHLAERDLGATPTAPVETLSFAEARIGAFPVNEVAHGEPCFGDAVEIAYPPGEDGAPGPGAIWMRAPALLADETPSSFQRLCPLADCGNAISRNAEIDAFSFVNADLTIVAHRQTTAEWLASRARSEWRSTGIGLSTAVIHDEQGPVATALQTLVLRRSGA